MTSGTPRAERLDASPPPSNGTATRRTLPVGDTTSETAPTTAQLIHRTDASVARPIYAGLGVALHHFTEMLAETVDPLVLHRATTVLTKQVADLLERDDALDAIQRLVTDPARLALPDGRRAIDVCAEDWETVRAAARERAIASCDGAAEFGVEAIINLAVVRGVGADEPWWGTPAWSRRVEAIGADLIDDDARTRLLEQPESAEDRVLAIAVHERSRLSPVTVGGSTEPADRDAPDAATSDATAEVRSLGSVPY